MGVEFVELRKNRGRSVIDYVTGLMGMECLSSCIAYLGERHIHMPPPPIPLQGNRNGRYIKHVTAI